MDGMFDGLFIAGLAHGLTTEEAAQRALEQLGDSTLSSGESSIGLDSIPVDWDI